MLQLWQVAIKIQMFSIHKTAPIDLTLLTHWTYLIVSLDGPPTISELEIHTFSVEFVKCLMV